MSYESKTGQPLTEDEQILLGCILNEAFHSDKYNLQEPMIISITEKVGIIGTALEMQENLKQYLNDPFS